MSIKRGFPYLVVLSSLLFSLLSCSQRNDSFQVSIEIDAAKTVGELEPLWRFFGADEPNYAYMKDGKKLLAQMGALSPGNVYFRAHALLCTGDGTPSFKWGSTNIYTEDAAGNPVYDWTLIDRIFDAYLERGVRPYVEIGFMPKALSTQPEPYETVIPFDPRSKAGFSVLKTGRAYPPKDYDKWRELCFQWVKHNIDRYGKEEVEKWYWQVWNEPNIHFWKGTIEEFYKLHDYAIDGVLKALPSARVGGPHNAGGGGGRGGAELLLGFMDHTLNGTNYATGEKGGQVDFLSFHAKGGVEVVDGFVRMNMGRQLTQIESAFDIIASVPEMKDKPIVIGECDPDGTAAAISPGRAYRNTEQYSSYTAASFGRLQAMADQKGVNIKGALTWAFEFEDQPWFAGFRVLASNGVNLPVMNVFRMFSKMSGQRLYVESDGSIPLEEIINNSVRDRADVSAIASMDNDHLYVLLWHYHDDYVKGAEAEIEMELAGLSASFQSAKLTHYRVDFTHSNAFTMWNSMGKPQDPTEEQYSQLEQAGLLAQLGEPGLVKIKKGKLSLPIELPRQAVSLLVFDLE